MLFWILLYTCLLDLTLGKVLVNLEILSFHPEYFSLEYYDVPGDVVIGAVGFTFALVLLLKTLKVEFTNLERNINT